jgi:hypothetical protein
MRRHSSGLQAAKAIKFGIAIRPLTISASLHTVPVLSVALIRMTPAWIHANRPQTSFPNKYWAHLAP